MRVLPQNFLCSSCTCCSKCSPALCPPSSLNLEDSQQVSPISSPVPDAVEEVEEVEEKSSNGGLKVEDRISGDGRTEDKRLLDGKAEEERGVDNGKAEEWGVGDVRAEDSGLEERNKAKIFPKSSLKKPSDSGPREMGRRRVKWMDFEGEELTEIREFENDELGDSGGESSDYRNCICVIQ